MIMKIILSHIERDSYIQIWEVKNNYTAQDYILVGENDARVDLFKTLKNLIEKYELQIDNANLKYLLEICIPHYPLFFNQTEDYKYITKISTNLKWGIINQVHIEEISADMIFSNGTFNYLIIKKFENITLDTVWIWTIQIAEQWNWKNLCFSNLNINGNLVFKDFTLNKLKISKCNIVRWMKFSIYWSIIEALELSDIELPEEWWLPISNSTINSVFFHRISLEKLKLNCIRWNGFEKLQKKLWTQKNSPSEMKEFYRQLKNSHDEIWNKTEANKFFAKEMEYYEKSLTWKEWDKKTISFIQRFSNNYGNSWIRPFLWIIGISFLYTFSFDCWNFYCTCWWAQNWECFWDYWLKNLSQFPAELKNINSWPFFIYVIIMGSLIYQLLVALRRISQR